jgi:hypothetical protein
MVCAVAGRAFFCGVSGVVVDIQLGYGKVNRCLLAGCCWGLVTYQDHKSSPKVNSDSPKGS